MAEVQRYHLPIFVGGPHHGEDAPGKDHPGRALLKGDHNYALLTFPVTDDLHLTGWVCEVEHARPFREGWTVLWETVLERACASR